MKYFISNENETHNLSRLQSHSTTPTLRLAPTTQQNLFTMSDERKYCMKIVIYNNNYLHLSNRVVK